MFRNPRNVKWVVVALSCLAMAGPAMSAGVPSSTLWTTVCQSCHEGKDHPTFVATPSNPPLTATYPPILSSNLRSSYTWLSSAAGLKAHIESIATAASTMKPYYDTYIAGGSPAVDELRIFLLAALDGAFDKSSINFGSSDINVAKSDSVTITNLRASNLVVNTGSISVSDPTHYLINPASSTCFSQPSLVPGGSCTVSVSFKPASAGLKSANLQVQLDPAGGDPGPALASIALSGTGSPPPVIPVPILSSGNIAALMDRPVGESSTVDVTLANVGNAPITQLSVAIQGAAAADYAFTEDCATNPPSPGGVQTCTVRMTFKPSALGVREGTLAVSYSGGVPRQDFTLPIVMNFRGIVPPTPTATLTASTDFGSQGVNNVYPPRRLIYTNSGVVTISNIAVSISGAGFSLVSPACPATLVPGAKCNIDVQFTPTQVDTSYTGVVSVASNAENAPHKSTLNGRGLNEPTPVLAWSAVGAAVDFGAVAVGAVKEVDVTLTNPGPAAVILKVANILGVHAQSFLVVPSSCQFNDYLTAGQSCQFKLTFKPGSSGTKLADVQAGTTGSAPGLLTVTGIGLSGPEPKVGLSSGALSYAPVRVGSSSVPQVITLHSNGSVSLQITGIAVSGAFVISEQTCAAPPFNLEPGFDCTLSVSFKPASEGVLTGSVKIASNAADLPELQVSLSGQADPAPKTSGGGGCSLAQGDSPLDPTLWLLAAGALGVLWWRRQAGARREAGRLGRKAA